MMNIEEFRRTEAFRRPPPEMISEGLDRAGFYDIAASIARAGHEPSAQGLAAITLHEPKGGCAKELEQTNDPAMPGVEKAYIFDKWCRPTERVHSFNQLSIHLFQQFAYTEITNSALLYERGSARTNNSTDFYDQNFGGGLTWLSIHGADQNLGWIDVTPNVAPDFDPLTEPIVPDFVLWGMGTTNSSGQNGHIAVDPIASPNATTAENLRFKTLGYQRSGVTLNSTLVTNTLDDVRCFGPGDTHGTTNRTVSDPPGHIDWSWAWGSSESAGPWANIVFRGTSLTNGSKSPRAASWIVNKDGNGDRFAFVKPGDRGLSMTFGLNLRPLR